MSNTEWTSETPCRRGTFWIRGTEDKEESAVRIRIVSRETEPNYPVESVSYGLSGLRVFDVIGDGPEFKEFERRPLIEVDGCLWKEVKP